MHDATEIDHRAHGIPVEIDRRDTSADGPLWCDRKSPFWTVQIDHVALPAAVAPRRFSGSVPVLTCLSMEGSTSDVIDRKSDVEERHLLGECFQTEVAVDVDLRDAVDLVEAAQTMVAVPIEQKKIT